MQRRRIHDSSDVSRRSRRRNVPPLGNHFPMRNQWSPLTSDSEMLFEDDELVLRPSSSGAHHIPDRRRGLCQISGCYLRVRCQSAGGLAVAVDDSTIVSWAGGGADNPRKPWRSGCPKARPVTCCCRNESCRVFARDCSSAILNAMPEVAFNETIAATYDADSAEMFDTSLLHETVDFLAGFAGDGAALELGIGTGRVALPLSQRGVRVHGIDVSEAMVAKMRAKPGGDAISVTFGDIATTRAPGHFRLVYLPFNIITNLLTQAEQVACFRNAADHLEPGGHMVAETFVPQLQRLQPGERFIPFTVTPTHLGFDEYDVVNQLDTSHHYFIREGRAQIFLSHHRYAWPAELDLMAQWLAWRCANDGWTGGGTRSMRKAATTSRSGRSRRSRPAF